MSGHARSGITDAEVRQAWEGRLAPVVPALVPAAIPPGTRRFLTEVGLPTVEVLNVYFPEGGHLPDPVRQGQLQFLVVTADHSHICLAVELSSERAFEFAAAAAHHTRVINSDIAALLYFLGVLRTTMSRLDDLDEQGLLDAEILAEGMAGIRASLLARDPTAGYGQTPWTLLLNDLESQFE
ncbi:SUKH-4 family immunity protein [Micromonospora sp. NPDC049903]|uniref:SUKH-4 family immunity protein n=1 Tax=Micromonospora sp. NPDC049903 TaxID=3364276 RepID=UPI00378A9E7F